MKSPRNITIFAVLAFLGSTAGMRAVHAADEPYTVTIDPEARFQTLEGWGTSLAWWANIVGGFPDSYRKDYITKLFDPVNGLGLNIVRYEIGGGEDPAYHTIQSRAQIPGFEPSADTWDWTADANQRWMLTQAVAHGVNIVEAFSCSPPAWMTVSGSVTGAKDGSDNLKPENYGHFADYLTEVIKHYHDTWGVTFQTVEPMNEATSPWWKFGGAQEGCHFDRASQASLIKQVAASLTAHGLKTTVSASDEANIDEALASLSSYDATTLSQLSQVNTHNYSGSGRLFLRRAALQTKKRLWMSEYGDNDPSGLTLSKMILNDMKNLQPTAWLYWQAVDSAGVWGCLDNPEDGATFRYTINPKYYVFGNYTKFIRPGYTFIGVSGSNSLAAYDATTKTLVIVSTNATQQPVDATFDLSHFDKVGAVTPHVTSPTQHLEEQGDVTVSDRQFRYQLPASSVTTFVVSGADRDSTTKPRFVADGYYKITSRCSNLLLTVNDASKTAGAGIVQAPDTGTQDQQWHLLRVGADYKLVNRGSGLRLEISGAGLAQGNYAVQAADNDSNAQKWQVIYDGGGYYKLINRNSLMNLDVYGQLTAAGTPIDQCPDAGTTNQLWSIVPVQ